MPAQGAGSVQGAKCSHLAHSHFQLKHERLYHSVDGPEDAHGRARDLEELARYEHRLWSRD